jgi:hypothetical protein
VNGVHHVLDAENLRKVNVWCSMRLMYDVSTDIGHHPLQHSEHWRKTVVDPED